MTYYTSLSGLQNAQTELSTLSNNLANAETTGFKSSTVNFADLVASSANANPKMVEGIGSTVKSIDQDFSTGSFETTGSALNMAINGNGFFTVVSPTSGATEYTRNGDFSTDASGYVVDGNNSRLQILAYNSTSGTYATTTSDAQLPTTNSSGSSYSGVSIDSDGVMTASYADGTTSVIGKVALASFSSPGGLLQVGTQDWTATSLSGAATYASAGTGGMGSILSSTLEESNVDLSSQLVSLIGAQQYFQANSKAISTDNQMISTILNAVQ